MTDTEEERRKATSTSVMTFPSVKGTVVAVTEKLDCARVCTSWGPQV